MSGRLVTICLGTRVNGYSYGVLPKCSAIPHKGYVNKVCKALCSVSDCSGIRRVAIAIAVIPSSQAAVLKRWAMLTIVMPPNSLALGGVAGARAGASSCARLRTCVRACGCEGADGRAGCGSAGVRRRSGAGAQELAVTG